MSSTALQLRFDTDFREIDVSDQDPLEDRTLSYGYDRRGITEAFESDRENGRLIERFINPSGTMFQKRATMHLAGGAPGEIEETRRTYGYFYNPGCRSRSTTAGARCLGGEISGEAVCRHKKAPERDQALVVAFEDLGQLCQTGQGRIFDVLLNEELDRVVSLVSSSQKERNYRAGIRQLPRHPQLEVSQSPASAVVTLPDLGLVVDRHGAPVSGQIV